MKNCCKAAAVKLVNLLVKLKNCSFLNSKCSCDGHVLNILDRIMKSASEIELEKVCLHWTQCSITLKQNLHISMPCLNMLQCVTHLFNSKNFVLTVPCDEMLIRPCISLTSKEISIQHFSQNLLWQCKVHRYIHPHFLHFIELVDASFWVTSDLRISS